jgi:SPP1 gp7 family putative phage head morphogenesis protein
VATEYDFSLGATDFKEAVNAFLDKKIMSKAAFDALSAEMKVKAFTAAYVHGADELQTVYDSVLKAIATGTTLAQFKKDTEGILTRPWHRETVFRTNVLSAYGKGHYDRAMELKDLRPYGRYSAILDGRTRPSHAALHGLVYPLDHPFWKTYWPPWGYNCRCGVTTLTQEQVDREKLPVRQDMQGLPAPDGKFGSPAAGEDWRPDFGKYDGEIGGQLGIMVKGIKGETIDLPIGRDIKLPAALEDIHWGVKLFRDTEIDRNNPKIPYLLKEIKEFLDLVKERLSFVSSFTLTEVVGEIRIWGRHNPFDAELAEMYGAKDMASALTGGNRRINIWQPALTNYPYSAFKSDLGHEWGHNLAMGQFGSYGPPGWEDLTMSEGWTTNYSASYKNIYENFAETIKLFISRGPESKSLAAFPRKKAFIQRLLGAGGE